MTYQAEARIICRLFGSAEDVVIGERTAQPRTHPSFVPTSIAKRLIDVPPAAVGSVPDDDGRIAFERARAFVAGELPAAYAIDPRGALSFPGHAWVEGHWRPTGGNHVSYGFPLLRNNEPIEEQSVFRGPTGKEQTITFSWWVVVQPQ